MVSSKDSKSTSATETSDIDVPVENDNAEEEAESNVEVRQREIDVTDLFDTFLEEDDPQTTHMVLFRVAEIVLNKSPSRVTQELMKQLTKAGDSAARAVMELDSDLAMQHEARFEQRKLRAYEIAASVQEL